MAFFSCFTATIALELPAENRNTQDSIFYRTLPEGKVVSQELLNVLEFCYQQVQRTKYAQFPDSIFFSILYSRKHPHTDTINVLIIMTEHGSLGPDFDSKNNFCQDSSDLDTKLCYFYYKNILCVVGGTGKDRTFVVPNLIQLTGMTQEFMLNRYDDYPIEIGYDPQRIRIMSDLMFYDGCLINHIYFNAEEGRIPIEVLSDSLAISTQLDSIIYCGKLFREAEKARRQYWNSRDSTFGEKAISVTYVYLDECHCVSDRTKLELCDLLAEMNRYDEAISLVQSLRGGYFYDQEFIELQLKWMKLRWEKRDLESEQALDSILSFISKKIVTLLEYDDSLMRIRDIYISHPTADGYFEKWYCYKSLSVGKDTILKEMEEEFLNKGWDKTTLETLKYCVINFDPMVLMWY